MRVTANPIFWLITIGVVAVVIALVPGMVGANWETMDIPWILAGLVWTTLFFVGVMRGTQHLLDSIRGGSRSLRTSKC